MRSLWGSTQAMAQRVGVVAVHPLVQARVAPTSPATIAQMGVGSEQETLQRPQAEGVVRSVSQPVAASPSQSPRPARQASVRTHVPRAQVTRSMSTPGSARQLVPQPPQFMVLFEVSTHIAPQRVRPAAQVLASAVSTTLRSAPTSTGTTWSAGMSSAMASSGSARSAAGSTSRPAASVAASGWSS